MTASPPTPPATPPDPSAAASARAAALLNDDTLSRTKGTSPEHIEARRRVAALFCDLHLPDPKNPNHLTPIDFTQTVSVINARGLDTNNPKATGIPGFRRKPAFLLSILYPPKSPDDPLYALEYYPLKS